MGIVAIVLAVLGLVILLISWKKEDPVQEEMLTALKGIAYVKREVERLEESLVPLQTGLSNLNERMLCQEQLISPQSDKMEDEAWLKKAQQVLKTLKSMDKKTEVSDSEKKSKQKSSRKSAQKQEELQNRGGIKDKDGRDDRAIPEPAPAVSNIHKNVLELANQGLSVQEIALRLDLSQDAVNMVLRTVPGGNQV